MTGKNVRLPQCLQPSVYIPCEPEGALSGLSIGPYGSEARDTRPGDLGSRIETLHICIKTLNCAMFRRALK